MSLGGGAFEKGKRGCNEPKVTLFTKGTEFLVRRLNLTQTKNCFKKTTYTWCHYDSLCQKSSLLVDRYGL